MELSLSVVQLLVVSTESFPIELDDAWKWLGFPRKSVAKKILLESFEKDLDFFSKSAKASGGRPSEVYMLTVDCFKSMGMMANTPKGREVRKYFLECERQVKEMARSQPLPPQPLQPHPDPAPPIPATLPPAPGWEPEVWEILPPTDQKYFAETPEEKAQRVALERRELARFLNAL